MEFLTALIVVICGAVLLGLITQDRKSKKRYSIKKQSFKKKSFKEVVQSTFPKYIVREKNEQIMICEYNHKNEPDELVFIRINQPTKNIRKSGRMIIAHYVNEPSPGEMKGDFGRFL